MTPNAAAQEPVNLTALVLRHARSRPDQLALVVPTLSEDGGSFTEASVTFGELGTRVSQAMTGLEAQGFVPGDRIVLMAPLSTDLYALLLGILASGLSAVFVDTGMGKDKILQALTDARAQAIISVAALLKYRWLLRPLWRLRKYSADSKGLGVRPLSALFSGPGEARDARETHADDHALITFTSGSTGRPKGADRTQGLLVAQHLALAEHFPGLSTAGREEDGDSHNSGTGDVDMPCFPVVTLHNLCCGVPTVLPAVDFKAPATVKASFVFEQIGRWGVTRMSGAPAYIERLVAVLEARGATETRVKQLGVGGAPTPISLCERIAKVFPNTEAQVIYGSTEAEPIASVDMGEIVAAADQAATLGHLVGTLAHAATGALVDLPEPAPDLDDQGVTLYQVPDGAPGELIVSGPHVNRSYLDNPEADRANKLHAPDGTIWHRTGDVASFDGQGRLWLRGRVKDLVRHAGQAIHPLPIEAAVSALDGVRRAALLNTVRHPDGVLVVELWLSTSFSPASAGEAVEVDEATITASLEAFGLAGLPQVRVDSIPMDYRHNSKIDRVALRKHLEAT